MIEHVVPTISKPIPLARYVSRALPFADIRDIMKKRDVKVDGVRRNRDFILYGGENVRVYANYDMSITVLDDTGGYVAVQKPQGLPVDTDIDNIGFDTALNRVKLMYPTAKLCHRLDAQTGGVLLFATDDSAYDKALIAFRERTVHKTYSALTGGRYAKKSGEYRDYIVKDKNSATVKIAGNIIGASPVITKWNFIGSLNAEISKVELEPVTGKTHQLRAHMAHYLKPILGDDKYGDRDLNKRYGVKLCLWCAYLNINGHEFASESPDWLGDRFE